MVKKGIYRTKQLLPFRGKLYLMVFIRDSNNQYSRQVGTDDGIPVSSTGGDSFGIMKENAVLNALYKHFQQKGTPFSSAAQKKDGMYDYSNMISKLKILDYYIEYFKTRRYNFKTVNRKGKRYTEIRRDGKFNIRKRFTYKKNAISDREIL